MKELLPHFKPRMVLQMRKFLLSLCALQFGFRFFEVLPSGGERGFLCQCWGISTSLACLQSVVSGGRLDQVGFVLTAFDSFAFLVSSTSVWTAVIVCSYF